MCINTVGSFECACYPGSIGNGLSCGQLKVSVGV